MLLIITLPYQSSRIGKNEEDTSDSYFSAPKKRVPSKVQMRTDSTDADEEGKTKVESRKWTFEGNTF